MSSFTYNGHRLAYETYGSGERTLVLTHGLLMNGGMFTRLGPAMATHGNRVVCLDLLGHGDSDAPPELELYSMTSFAAQVVALLDHLGVEQAVIGGTSLGANVSLELAAQSPERARALLIEMPVLDNAIVATAVAFTPVLVGAQIGAPALGFIARAARRLPRSHYLADILLDWVRRDPRGSSRVLRGLIAGRTCPPRSERERIEVPALIIGHPADPIHPFSDSDELAREMPNARLVDANSIIEWRLRPKRLNRELAAFLDHVWAERATPHPAV